MFVEKAIQTIWTRIIFVLFLNDKGVHLFYNLSKCNQDNYLFSFTIKTLGS